MKSRFSDLVDVKDDERLVEKEIVFTLHNKLRDVKYVSPPFPLQPLVPTKVRNPNVNKILQKKNKVITIPTAKKAEKKGEDVVHENKTEYESFLYGFTTRMNTANRPRMLVSEMDKKFRECFEESTDSLNEMQTVIYPAAISQCNILLCAPTSAGKTNVAILTIISTLYKHCCQPPFSPALKVIYIAPMKSLTSEITRTLQKRLKILNLVISELTSDTDVSPELINMSHILVTTPEKFDVITRKYFSFRVVLLIIDEVHLLNSDRGAVLESIVARALRTVELAQETIRIVGLSATLPNYKDVAKWLHVSENEGL